MSALAKHALKSGFTVTGSDAVESDATRALRWLGAEVFVGECDVPCDLLVHTSALPPTHPELVRAHSRGTPVLLREQYLGQIFNRFPVRVAVCGTHGKTTVTAMIHTVLEGCGVPHTAFVGGYVNGENYFNSGNDVIVAEACEYHAAFLNMKPTLCVCLNVRYDHPDCYPSAAHVKRAFLDLFRQSQRVLAPRGLYCRAQPFLKCRKKGISALRKMAFIFPFPRAAGTRCTMRRRRFRRRTR